MQIEIEDFKTGWFGLTIGLKQNEVDQLINALKSLKQDTSHFHMRSNYDGSGGVGDIEFYIQDENEKSNMELDSSPAFYTKK